MSSESSSLQAKGLSEMKGASTVKETSSVTVSQSAMVSEFDLALAPYDYDLPEEQIAVHPLVLTLGPEHQHRLLFPSRTSRHRAMEHKSSRPSCSRPMEFLEGQRVRKLRANLISKSCSGSECSSSGEWVHLPLPRTTGLPAAPKAVLGLRLKAWKGRGEEEELVDCRLRAQ